MTTLHRAAAYARRTTPDVLVLVGIALLAYGFGQAPAPLGGMLGPIVLGLALVAAVRFGTR